MIRFICGLLYGILDFMVLFCLQPQLSQKSHILISKDRVGDFPMGREQWGLVSEILSKDERHLEIISKLRGKYILSRYFC